MMFLTQIEAYLLPQGQKRSTNNNLLEKKQISNFFPQCVNRIKKSIPEICWDLVSNQIRPDTSLGEVDAICVFLDHLYPTSELLLQAS